MRAFNVAQTHTPTPPTCSLWFFTIHNLWCHTAPSTSKLLVFGFFYYLKGRMTLSSFHKCKKWVARRQRNARELLGFPNSLLALKVTTALLAGEKVVILPVLQFNDSDVLHLHLGKKGSMHTLQSLVLLEHFINHNPTALHSQRDLYMLYFWIRY